MYIILASNTMWSIMHPDSKSFLDQHHVRLDLRFFHFAILLLLALCAHLLSLFFPGLCYLTNPFFFL